MPTSILTLNTWKGDGAYRTRLGLMTGQLKALNPDFVLLQEVLRGPAGGPFDTLAQLNQARPGHCSYLPMRRKKRQVEGQEVDSFSGMAIWSRFPIQQTLAAPLPSSPADGGRVGQWIQVDTGTTKVVLGNLHLSFLPDQADLQIAQLNAMLTLLPLLLPADWIVLGGDFNCTPEAPPLQWLHHHPQWQVRDLFHALHPTLAGHTFITSPQSGRRIDYLLALAPRAGTLPVPLNATMVMNQAENGLYPSDHFGVMATLP